MSITGTIQDLAKQSATTIWSEGWSVFFRKTVGVVRSWIATPRFQLRREDIANMYLTGTGIEIGALHYPLKVPAWAKVQYVDRLPLSELRQQFPELASKKLVDVQIVADGERLSTIPDGSQDFVIGNHFLEHCENPVEAIRNMLRVLRSRGITYLSIPDKRYTFDVDRPVTSTEHIMQDYEQGPAGSKRTHFEEWARIVEKIPEDQVEARVSVHFEKEANIHYHVWTQTEILEMVLALKKTFGFNFEVELFYKNGIEIVLILRKEG